MIMSEQKDQPFKSIRRKSFIENFGIPEEDGILQSSERDSSQRDSTSLSISIGDFGNSDKGDMNLEESAEKSNEDLFSSFSSNNAPNFAGGAFRRRGNRDRRIRAETRFTIGANNQLDASYVRDSTRRTSTGSLEHSFGEMSLQSFTSDTSFTSGNSMIGQKGLQIANLLFVTDSEMMKIMYANEDRDCKGEIGKQSSIQRNTSLGASMPPSSILGTGAFSTVRLAWRKTPSSSEVPDNIANSEIHQNTTGGRHSHRSIVRVESHNSNSSLPDNGQLVAVKMIEKSILKQMKTMQKGPDNRLTVKTAFDDIEKEIATMKRLSHPNCVQLFEVIDSVESDKLYMVLEFVSLGEILSNVDGTDRYERKRYRRKVKGLTPNGFFDEKHAALYFVDVLHGLAYLHRHNIVHRDLKPEK